MTHTLHRRGSVECLSKDFPSLMMASQNINVKGSAAKLKRYLELAIESGAINIGDGTTGLCYCGTRDFKRIIDGVNDGVVAHSVFDSEENLLKFLKRIKEEDLGISVVSTGLFDIVHANCAKAGITPNAINMSLGIYGKTDKLPSSSKALDIMTMCGHAMVTEALVWFYVDKIKAGTITSLEAALRLGSLCVCGIFNQNRCAKILEELVKER